MTSSINEGMSAGYVSSQFDDANGFSYTILPLAFNLQQKGNSKPNNKGLYPHYPGDHVRGVSDQDGKKHTGVITSFRYNPENSKPEIAYIVDDKTSKVIPLKADTVKTVTYRPNDARQLDYFKKNQNKQTLLDVQGLSESAGAGAKFDFNRAVEMSMHK